MVRFFIKQCYPVCESFTFISLSRMGVKTVRGKLVNGIETDYDYNFVDWIIKCFICQLL